MIERIMPEDFGSPEFADVTTAHAGGLIALFIVIGLVFLLPRRHVLIPVIVFAIAIPISQRIVVGGLDFTFLRLIVIAGMLRVLVRQNFRGFQLTRIDWIVIAFFTSKALIHVVHTGRLGTVVFELGYLLEGLGFYFLFRIFVQGIRDVERVASTVALLAVPVAVVMIGELFTQRNLFSIFGGIPEYTMERQGRVRAQASFVHPIAAGCFFAAWVPLFAGFLWLRKTKFLLFSAGCTAAVVIVFCSASSTPVFSVLAAVVALAVFPARYRMRPLFWGSVSCLAVLHMLMNAPVWHLIARVSAVSGSTSYHRYALIDGFINHFNEWWLTGTSYTGHWSFGAQDLTNHFVYVGVQGGLVSLVLFVALISVAFKAIGLLIKRSEDPARQWIYWALGAMLFTHCMSFIGTSYSGKLLIVFHFTIAIIASCAAERQPNASTARKRAGLDSVART